MTTDNSNSPTSGEPKPLGQPPQQQLPPALLAQMAAANAQRAQLPYLGTPLFAFPGGVGIPMQVPAQLASQQAIQIWQGDFPPPDAMERLEKLQPGAFDRMLKMSERRLEAQIAEVTKAQQLSGADTRRSHYFGIVSHVFAIGGCVTCAVLGILYKQNGVFWVAGALVSLPVMAVAKSFAENFTEGKRSKLNSAAQPQAPAANLPSTISAPPT